MVQSAWGDPGEPEVTCYTSSERSPSTTGCDDVYSGDTYVCDTGTRTIQGWYMRDPISDDALLSIGSETTVPDDVCETSMFEARLYAVTR